MQHLIAEGKFFQHADTEQKIYYVISKASLTLTNPQYFISVQKKLSILLTIYISYPLTDEWSCTTKQICINFCNLY